MKKVGRIRVLKRNVNVEVEKMIVSNLKIQVNFLRQVDNKIVRYMAGIERINIDMFVWSAEP
ncbi:hypothetical protein IEQ34_009764 [Dendrobium chrysotoxum]|uniref:Uncharacterized protein n=1 Tax=Dendrobium chrysotoxum TaxID=161865 RepID=A0AAV7H2B6_DENCH|nr:hypothetical protein IEQ34_009764 [Dendrobium chrysotoxum]